MTQHCRMSAVAALVVPLLLLPLSASGLKRPLRICASIPPQAYLIERVGEGRVTVSVLIERGQSPHTFEPAPRLVADFSGSDVCFSIGLPFEDQVLEDLRSANPNLVLVDSSAGVELLGSREASDSEAEGARSGDDHGGDRENHGHIDPHIWLAPAAAIRIAANIRDGLVRLDPPRSDEYEQNFASLEDELIALDEEIAAMLEPYEGESFYVFHAAYGYFADAYGLEQVSIEAGGKEPGPRDLAAIISEARSRGVKTLFVQPQHPASVAETAAREIGAEVVSIDPLAHDYFAMMRETASRIAEALAKRSGETPPKRNAEGVEE